MTSFRIRGTARTVSALGVLEHEFESRDGGTLMRDRVRYAVPLDVLVHKFFVQQDVARIFAYRTERLRRRFGASGIDLPVNAVNVDP